MDVVDVREASAEDAAPAATGLRSQADALAKVRKKRRKKLVIMLLSTVAYIGFAIGFWVGYEDWLTIDAVYFAVVTMSTVRRYLPSRRP